MANEFRVKNGIISPNIGTDSGDFTIDSAGDVIIDADGADVLLKDGGTEFGRFKRDSSNFVIKSATNDKDIIFKGVDNSATITALTLDMSEAGAASFNSGVTIGGNLTIPDDIVHSGDTNNLISFGTDTQSFETGGTARFNISNSGLQIGSGARVTTIDTGTSLSTSDTTLSTTGAIKSYVDSSVGSAGGGDITAVTAGVGLSGGGDSGGVTLTLDMSELTDMTADVTDNADEFIILDGGADRRKMMNEIDVGGFRDVITGPFHFETDQENVALGEGALDSLTQYVSGLVTNGGNNNTAIGENAGTAVSTGDSNTLLGHDAGETITTGSSNTVVGAGAEPSAVDASNQIVIGSGAVGLADNAVVLGNTSITAWLPPDDAGVDLGSSSYQFKDGYFHGTLEADAITLNGTSLATSATTDTTNASNIGSGTLATGRLAAALTAQTSILNTSLVVGRDSTEQIKFSTNDQIIFRVGNADGVIFKSSGEIEATSLDISGDVDVDGTLEADAITVNGSALASSATTDTTNASNIGSGTLATGRLAAALTAQTSMLNASLVVGRDADNQIKFSTDNQMIFRVGAGDGVTFKASGEIEATKFDGALEGNADTATALATARTIGGVSFDGTAAITVSSATGDFSIGDDLTLGSNAAVINFGGDSEIKLTHVHDTGLLLTDSGGSPTLQLHDANESVSSDGSKLILTSNGVAFSMPTADGSNGQQLTTNGSGTLSWAASGSSGGSGISDIVEDTSPQLGGDLDTNGHDIIIDDGKGIYADAISNGRELLLFQHTVDGSGDQIGNSYLQVWNGVADAATGTLFGNDVVHTDTTNIGRITGPGIEATGSTTDVGMSFRTKGLGQFSFFSDETSASGAPVVNLIRYVDDGDVADDDILGQIKWMGGQSSMVSPFLHDLRTYAKIEANLVDVTTGSTDGNLMFSAMVANSHTDYLEVGTNKTNDTSAGVRAYTGSMVTVSGTGTTALSRDTHAGAYVRATGAGTFTLWDNPNIGDQVVVISDHGGTTTIDGYSNDTINGAANTTITTQYNAKTFIATSTTTWIALG